MNFLVALVDKRADPDGALMEYSFKIASTMKTASDDGTDTCEIATHTGHTITIDGTARTAYVYMGGVPYPVIDAPPPDPTHAKGRSLRKGRRGGFLSTSGSFTLSTSSDSNTAGT